MASYVYVRKDFNNHLLYTPIKLRVDRRVKQEIDDNNIELATTKNGSSVLVMKKNGSYVVGSRTTNDRSFAKLVTGKARTRRRSDARQYDYRLTAFNKPSKAATRKAKPPTTAKKITSTTKKQSTAKSQNDHVSIKLNGASIEGKLEDVANIVKLLNT